MSQAERARPELKLQHWTFLALLVLCGFLFWRTIEPLWVPIFLGLIIAISVNPIHLNLKKRWPKHPGISAALLTAMVMLGALVVVVFLGMVVGKRVLEFAREVAKRYQNKGPMGLVGHDITSVLSRFGVDAASVREHVASLAETVAGGLGKSATALVAGAFQLIFIFIFTSLTSFYLLLQGEVATRWFVDVLPLPDRQVWELVRNFRDVTRAMLAGTGITSAYQGAIAFAGYWILGIPDPVVWGALTGVASLLPGIGTTLVWGPICAYLFATGAIGKGLGLLAWGSFAVIAFADYWLRPRLVGNKLRMNDLLVFIAIFGGVEAFGIMGLIIGPIFAALFFSLIHIYQREYRPHLVADDPRPTPASPVEGPVAEGDRRQSPRPPAAAEAPVVQIAQTQQVEGKRQLPPPPDPTIADQHG